MIEKSVTSFGEAIQGMTFNTVICIYIHHGKQSSISLKEHLKVSKNEGNMFSHLISSPLKLIYRLLGGPGAEVKNSDTELYPLNIT